MLIYFKRKMLMIFALGITSGLPLSLSASTLSALLAEHGIDLAKITVFAIASTPYAFKYLWAPLLDNVTLPLFYMLGHRKGWLILTQILLMLSIVIVGLVNPMHHLLIMGGVTFVMAFLAATQDIIIDAMRIEMLSREEQGAGTAVTLLGYRLGMLLSGAGGLYLAEYLGWKMTYCLMPIGIVPGMTACLLYKEPIHKRNTNTLHLKDWLKHAFLAPFLEFINRNNWLVILLLIIFYKISDACLGMVTTPFLLSINFSKAEIASVVKLYGVIATLAGSLTAGYLLSKFSIMPILLMGGVLQALSNLAFIWQLHCGNNVLVLAAVTSIENFFGNIGATTLVAYISTLVNKEFTATHYALFSSIAVIGRTTICTSAGAFVQYLGWVNFFIFSAILSLPGLFCVYYLYKRSYP